VYVQTYAVVVVFVGIRLDLDADRFFEGRQIIETNRTLLRCFITSVHDVVVVIVDQTSQHSGDGIRFLSIERPGGLTGRHTRKISSVCGTTVSEIDVHLDVQIATDEPKSTADQNGGHHKQPESGVRHEFGYAPIGDSVVYGTPTDSDESECTGSGHDSNAPFYIV